MKKLFCLLLSFFVLLGVYGQSVSVDPTHSFYQDAEQWASLGLISQLPIIRPYPVQVVADILNTVLENPETEEDILKKATEYKKDILDKNLYISLGTTLSGKAEDKEGPEEFTFSDYQLNFFGGVTGDLFPMEKLGVGYSINMLGTSDRTASVLPYYYNYSYDVAADPADLGPLFLYIDMNSSFAYGTEKVYVQGGLNRSSFGYSSNNSISLGNQAPHTANLNLVINQEKWQYNQSIFALGGTNDLGGSLTGGKYMALHSLIFTPIPSFSWGYYENMIFGDSFTFSYLLPSPYMAIQGLGGFNDNLQMGITFQYTPLKGVVWYGDLLVDDIGANDLLKLDFDTKLRLGAQTGITYTARNSVISKLTAEYTMLSDYMYTHSQYDSTDTIANSSGSTNWQNYTSGGQGIGSNLPPNSDRFFLGLVMEPIENLTIRVTNAIIRHGNINESISAEEAFYYMCRPYGSYITDGSILNHYDNGGDDGNGEYLDTAWYESNFLEQDHLQTTWQLGVDASYDFKFEKQRKISLNLSYVLEYARNVGVATNMYPGYKNGSGVATEWTPSGEVATWKAEVEQAVLDAKEAWVANLHNVLSHYLTFSVKYSF